MARKKSYKSILEKIPTDKKIIAEKLIIELEFIENTLKRLRQQINEAGEVEHFHQGEQDFLRESPALKAYNSLVQRYSVMYRQLADLMGKSTEAEKSTALMEFLKEG